MAPYFMKNLVPRREKSHDAKTLVEAFRSVTWIQWALFFSGWLAWTVDSIDFFSVSLSVTRLVEQFGHDVHTITTSITLTLLFRSVGAVIFGIISDRYGRKWPLVSNLVLCGILQLGTGFVKTFPQFLALRSLFGVAMGGVWGMASATALENMPVELRGLASGVIQEGYAVGYLIAAVISLFLVPEVSQTWRALFWTACGVSFLAAAVRAVLPESEVFLRAKRIEAEKGTSTANKTKTFIKETKQMLKQHWLLCIYSVLLMTGFNFFSHGSQDLYPTYMEVTKGFSSHDATVATIIGNCGAIAGGAMAGFVSQYAGRRLTIIIFTLLAAVFIPLWIIPDSFGGLAAGAFCIQIGVQGAWGVIPIFLAEMSPPAFRATFPGVAYQVGNMVSSASAQIEATGGDHLKITLFQGGKPMIVADYAKVQGILIGVVAAWIVITTLLGPENHGARFEKHRMAFEEGGGRDDAVIEDEVEGDEKGGSRNSGETSVREDGSLEKRDV